MIDEIQHRRATGFGVVIPHPMFGVLNDNSLVSPLVMTFLLIKVSGVALLEISLASRSEEYWEYVVRTSAFVPWPPRNDGAEKADGSS